MSIITVNNVELEIDMLDADTAEHAEAALEQVARRCAEIKENKDLKLSQAIRSICQEVFICFNTIFGEGTDRRVFGGKTNLEQCMTALAELSRQAVAASGTRMQSLVTKYAPNREARRAAAKT